MAIFYVNDLADNVYRRRVQIPKQTTETTATNMGADAELVGKLRDLMAAFSPVSGEMALHGAIERESSTEKTTQTGEIDREAELFDSFLDRDDLPTVDDLSSGDVTDGHYYFRREVEIDADTQDSLIDAISGSPEKRAKEGGDIIVRFPVDDVWIRGVTSRKNWRSRSALRNLLYPQDGQKTATVELKGVINPIKTVEVEGKKVISSNFFFISSPEDNVIDFS